MVRRAGYVVGHVVSPEDAESVSLRTSAVIAARFFEKAGLLVRKPGFLVRGNVARLNVGRTCASLG